MLKIRLMRIGAKKRPFYRVVAVDGRAKRTGGYIENLGTYNPLTTPKEIILKQDRLDHWIKMGAQMSDGFLRIIGKAPQRKPRKPKKEQPEQPKPTEAESTEEVKTPQTQEVSEQPAEQVAENTDASTTPDTETPVAEAPAENATENAEPTTEGTSDK